MAMTTKAQSSRQEPSGQKKTLAFDALDLADLEFAVTTTRTSEAESIRRAVRLQAQLLRWTADGGSVELVKDGDRHRLVFL